MTRENGNEDRAPADKGELDSGRLTALAGSLADYLAERYGTMFPADGQVLHAVVNGHWLSVVLADGVVRFKLYPGLAELEAAEPEFAELGESLAAVRRQRRLEASGDPQTPAAALFSGDGTPADHHACAEAVTQALRARGEQGPIAYDQERFALDWSGAAPAPGWSSHPVYLNRLYHRCRGLAPRLQAEEVRHFAAAVVEVRSFKMPQALERVVNPSQALVVT